MSSYEIQGVIIVNINRFDNNTFGRKDTGIATSRAFLRWFKMLFRTLSTICDGVFFRKLLADNS